MPQIAAGPGPGQPERRRPRRQRRARASRPPTRPTPRARTSSRSPRWSSPATRSRTSRCGRRSRTRAAPALDAARRAARRARASAPWSWSSATSTSSPTADDRLGRPRGSPQNAAAVVHRRPGRRPLRQAPPAQLRRLRRVPLLRARLGHDGRAGRTASTSRSRSARTSGRTAARSPQVRDTGAGLLVVINGSPYERNKDDVRLELCARRAQRGRLRARLREHGRRPGRARVRRRLARRRRPTASLVARAPQFDEALLVVDLDLPMADPTTSASTAAIGFPVAGVHAAGRRRSRRGCPTTAEVWQALVVGLRDYVGKNGFRSVVLGLSGGIDSAVVAAIACRRARRRQRARRLAAERLLLRALQGRRRRHGRAHRAAPTARVADRADGRRVPGAAAPDRPRRGEPAGARARHDAHGDLERRGPPRPRDRQQERALGRLLDDLRRRRRRLRADQGRAQGRRVAARALAQRGGASSAARRRPIPPNSIEKPPSAELRPGQLDTDSLPDYEVLDDLLDDYVENDRGAAELVADGFDQALVERVLRLTDVAEYKRRQYPPGTKISVQGRSAATGGCRSRTAGARRVPEQGSAHEEAGAAQRRRGRRRRRPERGRDRWSGPGSCTRSTEDQRDHQLDVGVGAQLAALDPAAEHDAEQVATRLDHLRRRTTQNICGFDFACARTRWNS